MWGPPYAAVQLDHLGPPPRRRLLPQPHRPRARHRLRRQPVEQRVLQVRRRRHPQPGAHRDVPTGQLLLLPVQGRLHVEALRRGVRRTRKARLHRDGRIAAVHEK